MIPLLYQLSYAAREVVIFLLKIAGEGFEPPAFGL